MKINAFHTLCSKPSALSDVFYLYDYSMLVMILSALNWKKYMGNITLVADKTSIDYIKKYNLTFIWDKIEFLEYYDIDYHTFWAGSKILALKNQKAPVVMLDLDIIIWSDISSQLDEDIIAIHNEPLIKSVYKDKEYFNMYDTYFFDDFDWSILPSNTAFLYIKNDDFKQYYCNESINFMKNTKKTKDTLHHMLFAEQRLLSMCAKKKNKDIKYLIKYPQDIGNQNYFTHIWGYKNILSSDYVQNDNFCRRCVKRILSDFPKESLLLSNKDFFFKYI